MRTIEDHVELLIRDQVTIEKCYTEITTFWPDVIREEALAILEAKQKEGRFDVALKYRSTVLINKKEADKTPVISKVKKSFFDKYFK